MEEPQESPSPGNQSDDRGAPAAGPLSLGWVRAGIQRFIGLLRSVLLYYGQPFRHRRLVEFYSQFVGPDDLCFDLGAHLGNRTRAWLDLGAHVVAVEPQPVCVDWLARWFAPRAEVELVMKAVGSEAGRATMFVSRLTPTVSTLSRAWLDQVGEDPGFSGVRWQEAIEVEVTTLDHLIAEFGRPEFCKIDVEGAELEVLQGCSSALPRLSFEFIVGARQAALDCIDRIAELGSYEFQYGFGEPPRLQGERWMAAGDIKRVIEGLSIGNGSGDVYARLTG